MTISNEEALHAPGACNASSIQEFYDRHPYPPPVEDLDEYRRRWRDENRRRADFHLHWPDRPYRTDLSVLVAGCGTSQAARHALRLPGSQVIGIDLSETSIHHTDRLKRKYQLDNLDLHQLPIERVEELGRSFDKIVCTGVLHHLPDPEQGLRALQAVLEPDGAMNLMVYAAYGRAGVYMLQEYCRRLGVGNRDKDIQELAATLATLSPQHPLSRLLAETSDFQHRDGLADALLNPRDRAYTVPQLFDFIESCGLSFARWIRQAPYLPQCGSLARTPHAARLGRLPLKEQFAAIELLRGTLTRHSLISYRADRAPGGKFPRFDGADWLGYRPLRLAETLTVKNRLPPGAAAALINPLHADPDLMLPINAAELKLVEAIDGQRTLGEIIKHGSTGSSLAQRLFERLDWYDQVVFDISSI